MGIQLRIDHLISATKLFHRPLISWQPPLLIWEVWKQT